MASSQRADPFATMQQRSIAASGPDVVHLLAQLLAVTRQNERHLAAIAAALEETLVRPIAETDHKAMALMLPTLGSGLGPDGRRFTAAEALDDLRKHGFEVQIGAKAMGKLFARCAGVPIAGLRIRRDGKERGAFRWHVSRV